MLGVIIDSTIVPVINISLNEYMILLLYYFLNDMRNKIVKYLVNIWDNFNQYKCLEFSNLVLKIPLVNSF